MNNHLITVRARAIAGALAALNRKVVFLGGATVSFYADKLSMETRPTDDIDVIIEILSYNERVQLEERLRALGFTHDMESNIVCRYKIEGITVDIMPTNDSSIGFTNIWYPDGFKYAVNFKLSDDLTIRILDAPHFIATKLEAFKHRGNSDGRTSHDFEDIVFLLENREAIWDEMQNTHLKLKHYLL